MIKFESYLANNHNNNKSNIAIIENYTSSILRLLWLHSPYLKNVTKVVSCYIICILTTNTMSTFWVGDRIKNQTDYAVDVK